MVGGAFSKHIICLLSLDDGLSNVLKNSLKKKKRPTIKQIKSLVHPHPRQKQTIHEDNHHFLIKKLITTGDLYYAEYYR